MSSKPSGDSFLTCWQVVEAAEPPRQEPARAEQRYAGREQGYQAPDQQPRRHGKLSPSLPELGGAHVRSDHGNAQATQVKLLDHQTESHRLHRSRR